MTKVGLFLGFVVGVTVLTTGTINTTASSRLINDNAGTRAYIDAMYDKQHGDIPRTSIMYAYAEETETIYMGSSSMFIGDGDIIYTSPTGASSTCSTQGVGLIQDRNAEIGLPQPFNPTGYEACKVTAGAGEGGVWRIEFVSPQSGFDRVSPSGGNGTPIPATGNWIQGDNWGSISAWEIIVADITDTILPGRTFAKNMSLNTGTFNDPLNPVVFVKTREGFDYQVDLNGMRPFGFAFFANSSGYTDLSGNPLYKSLNLEGTNTTSTLPSGTDLLLPAEDDTATLYTHKIFFEEPDNTMPETAITADGGTTWLNPDLPSAPTVSNFVFNGEEGTPFKAGTNPLGGFFEFDTDYVGNFAVVVDLNDDGVFGNGADKVIGGASSGGAQTVYWDGTDVFGDTVPAGNFDFNAEVQIYLGEVHFPFFDVEHVPNGLGISRLSPANPVATQQDIMWDDRLLTPNTEPSCVTGGSVVPTSPVVELNGAPSNTGGARGYDNNYGNCKAIDTWSRIEYPLDITSTIELRESDLAVEYIYPQSPVSPGETINYTVRITNFGPTDKLQGTIGGVHSEDVNSIVGSCANCSSFTTNDDNFSGTFDLATGQSIDIEFQGVASPELQDEDTLIFTSTVSRSLDYSDNNQPNNSATMIIPVEIKEATTGLIRTGGK